MKYNKYIEIEETELMKLLVLGLRYALTRDNHLQPITTIEDIKKYLNKISYNQEHWYQFFIEEIKNGLAWEDFEPSNKQLLYDTIDYLLQEKQRFSREKMYKETLFSINDTE